jgi:hypothetical protein
MKKSKLFILSLLSMGLIFTSCEENEPNVISLPNIIAPTETSQLNAYFAENIENETEEFNVNPSDGFQTIYTSNGFSVSFYSNTFTYPNGNPVNGNFTIEIIDALTKKEMMMLNRPTFTNDGQLLVSGGIIYLDANQNGQQLSINDSQPVMVSIPSNGFDAMDFFDGSLGGNNDFGWDLSLEDTVTIVTMEEDTTFNPNGQGNMFSYNFTMDSIGWINCDYFYNSGDPLTEVNVVLPDGFNGSNSIVFIYYSNINSVANMHDYDNDSNFDLGSGYSTPIGMDVTFVTISELDSMFYFNITNSTITDNHLEEINILTPVNEQDLQTIIDNLP